ncbi:MAG: hypothetical protein Kow00109_07900 [Acidobacteriota bacterium]
MSRWYGWREPRPSSRDRRRHEVEPASSPGSRRRLVHWAAAGVFAGHLALGAETGQVPPDEQPAVKAEATAVLVDVVVTDDRGRAVRGLSREHFHVYEDGVEQEIVYFAEIGSPATPVVSEAAEAKSAEFEDLRATSLLEAHFIALVFDRLSPETRPYVRRAARQFLDELEGSGAWVGVFYNDLTLRSAHFFTPDLQAAGAAVDRALQAATQAPAATVGEWSGSGLSAVRSEDSSFSAARRRGDPGPGETNEAESSQQEGGPPNIDRLMEEMLTRMVQTLEILEATQQGYGLTDGLLAIVRSLEVLPGRKSVLFFSEGIPLPEAVLARFRSVIQWANLANVACYTVDAAGLRVESTGAASLRELQRLARGGGSSGPMLRNLERNEELLRADPHVGLKMLAEETGGFLLRDTNALGEGLRRIAGELQSYYLLAYTPRNSIPDGRYRRIEVRVDSPGARVRHRTGYYAVARPMDQPLLEYEAPALALADREPDRSDFPLQAGLFHFPSPEHPGAVALVADIPPGTLAYRPEPGRATSDFVVLALFRDPDGTVRRKLSQRYRLDRETFGPGADGILFYKEVDLPPGTYRVQVVAFDSVSGKGACWAQGVAVPAFPSGAPLLSSILLIRAAEPPPEGDATARLLAAQRLLLYPLLKPVVARSSGTLPFHFRVFGGPEPLRARIELRAGTRVFSSTEIALTFDSTGRADYFGTLPLDPLEPGAYRLQVSVPWTGEQGVRWVTRSRDFLLR